MYVVIILPEAFQNTAVITIIIYFEGGKKVRMHNFSPDTRTVLQTLLPWGAISVSLYAFKTSSRGGRGGRTGARRGVTGSDYPASVT